MQHILLCVWLPSLAILLTRVIHVDVGSYRSLITVAVQYSIVFIHFTVDELLGSFQSEAIVISTTTNTLVNVFW